jgi:NAD(P)-dependent dehydrogenase (short-subunit alcohol dehydrogenase family)
VSASQILQGKRAVVFGAGGSIGSAVAKEFAAEGAQVFLAGRSRPSLEDITTYITSVGGQAHAAVVDALDDAAVNSYIDALWSRKGRIDIVFNAVGPRIDEYGNGKHAVNLPIEEFMVPVNTVLKSQFITARAAARHMVKQGSGVIFFPTGSPARGHVEGATAIGAAFGAIEALTENLAVELSPSGVKVVCLRTTANVNSRTIQQTVEMLSRQMNVTQDEVIARMASLNFLKTPATVGDTARAAALLASDRARMLTGTTVNATAGAAPD